METGEGGFCSDRLVELINYCVAVDGTRERRVLCSRAARIAPLMGRSGGISPLLQGLSLQCSRDCQGKSTLRGFWINSTEGVCAMRESTQPTGYYIGGQN